MKFVNLKSTTKIKKSGFSAYFDTYQVWFWRIKYKFILNIELQLPMFSDGRETEIYEC